MATTKSENGSVTTDKSAQADGDTRVDMSHEHGQNDERDQSNEHDVYEEHDEQNEHVERDERDERDGKRQRRQAKQARQGRRGHQGQGEQLALSDVLPLATGQLAELLRCEPGSVSSVSPTDGGWTADVEVVEVERIPETTSVMGSYRVQLDERGRLLGYERTRRYAKGQLGR